MDNKDQQDKRQLLVELGFTDDKVNILLMKTHNVDNMRKWILDYVNNHSSRTRDDLISFGLTEEII
jgi:hypothetical protein